MKHAQGQKGFSLLELLLVIGVFTVIMTSVTVIFNNWIEDSIDRSVGRQIRDIQSAAESYVKLNFSDFTDTLNTIGDISEISLRHLKETGFVKQEFSGLNAYKQGYRIFVRYIDNDAISGPVFEVVTFGGNNLPPIIRMDDRRIMNAARHGGPKIGVISSLQLNPTCCDGKAQSMYGAWSVDLADYRSYYTDFANNDGGYMASYGRVYDETTLTDNYLFRLKIDGSPELNTMHTNLDMNGHSITNANTIVADSSVVSGSTNINGTEVSSLTSPYVLTIDGNAQFDTNLSTNSSSTSKGDIIITGDDNIGIDFQVTNNLTLPQGANGAQINAQSLDTSSMIVSGNGSFGTIDVNNADINAGNLYARDLTHKNQIETNSFQSQSASVGGSSAIGSIQSGNIIAIEYEIIDTNPSFSNDIAVENDVVVSGDVGIGNAVSVNNKGTISDMRTCNNGCP